jgi:hypothetical protein
MIRLNLVLDYVEPRLAQAWQRLKTQALDQGDCIRQGPTQHGHQLAFRYESAVEGGERWCCGLQHLRRDVICRLRCYCPVPTQGLVVTYLDGCDKAIAATAERFDDALLLAAVPNGLAGGCHVLVHGGVADALRRPEVLNQFILGNDAITMRNEVGQHIENLGPKWAGSLSVTEFVQVCVQCIVTEDIDHGPLLAARRERILPTPDTTL